MLLQNKPETGGERQEKVTTIRVQGASPIVAQVVALVLLTLATGSSVGFAQAVDADLVLRGGTVYDGTGSDGTPGDLAFKDGRIVAVGQFDAGQRISKVDKQLSDYIARQYKPCIFVVNKWDLMVKSLSTDRWVRYLRDTFRTMWHVPIAFITGQTGKNVKAVLNHAQMLYKQSRSRVATALLNKMVRAALEHSPPPLYRNRRPKIYYATQVAEQPPTIVLFCNNPLALSAQYQRYLLGVFRDQLSFGEVPIKLYLRKRQSHDQTDTIDSRLSKQIGSI